MGFPDLPAFVPSTGSIQRMSAQRSGKPSVRRSGVHSKMPTGLTWKNRELLKRLEDPATLAALINLPAQLVAEAEREPLSERSLAKAQAGIAICIGLFVGLRPANIASLAFDETLFLALRDDQESLIELPGDIVKNGDPFGTVLAPEGTALLRRYRDLILRPLLGRELTYLFDNGKDRHS